MKTTLPLIAAAAAVFIAVPAFADEPEAPSPEAGQQDKAEKEADARTGADAKEEKRICRRVKLDMSSRRGTKVCKTANEWREFNQRR